MGEAFAAIFIFGGFAAIGFSFTPLGKAIASRIRHGAVSAPGDPAVYEELDQIRQDMAELHERVDFAERLLAERESPRQVEG